MGMGRLQQNEWGDWCRFLTQMTPFSTLFQSHVKTLAINSWPIHALCQCDIIMDAMDSIQSSGGSIDRYTDNIWIPGISHLDADPDDSLRTCQKWPSWIVAVHTRKSRRSGQWDEVEGKSYGLDNTKKSGRRKWGGGVKVGWKG
jgi:hypothetical protein